MVVLEKKGKNRLDNTEAVQLLRSLGVPLMKGLQASEKPYQFHLQPPSINPSGSSTQLIYKPASPLLSKPCQTVSIFFNIAHSFSSLMINMYVFGFDINIVWK